MNQSQNSNLMENVSQKVINQIKEIKNETKNTLRTQNLSKPQFKPHTKKIKKIKRKSHATIQSTLISRTEKTQQTFSMSKTQQNHNSNPNTKTYLCYSIIA